MAPPPSTRSNSAMPVEIRLPSKGFTEARGTGFARTEREPETPAKEGMRDSWSATCSTRLFHSPHSGQRPSQRGWV